MQISTLRAEDFTNYKKPAMFIGTAYCDWKCCTENNLPITICQNNSLSKVPYMDLTTEALLQSYQLNSITKAVVIGGLEPYKQKDDIFSLIKHFRDNDIDDEFIIYTGYYKDEIIEWINELKQFKNIIIKYGRYIPNISKKYDNVLGVELISNNQYAEKIS